MRGMGGVYAIMIFLKITCKKLQHLFSNISKLIELCLLCNDVRQLTIPLIHLALSGMSMLRSLSTAKE